MCTFDAIAIARHVPQNGDTVQSFVEAKAILSGNLLLRGWHLPQDNYYFTDTVPFVIASLIGGWKLSLLDAVPVTIYGLVLMAALVLAAERNGLVACCLIVLWIGMLSCNAGWAIMVMPDMHMGTLLFCLAGFLLIEKCLAAEVRIWLPGIGLWLATALSVASDPLSLMFAWGPVIAVVGMQSLLQPLQKKTVFIACVVIAGIAAAMLLRAAALHAGGFITESVSNPHIVEASRVGDALIAVVFGVFFLSGAYAFGQDVTTAHGLAIAIRFLCVAAAPFAALYARSAKTMRFLDWVLAASVLFMCLFCVGSGQFAAVITPENLYAGGAAVRYVIPILVMGGILASRMIAAGLERLADKPRHACHLFLMTAVVIALGEHTHEVAMSAGVPWIKSSGMRNVADWLQAHHLSRGVGGYWESSTITALTGGKVTVCAVKPGGEKLVPYVWLSPENCPGYDRPQFIVAAEHGIIDARRSDATYGVAARVIPVAGYTVTLLPDAQ